MENCVRMVDYSVGKRGWELHKLRLPQTANQRVIVLPWKKDWERARYCCHPRSRVFSLVIVVQSLSHVWLFAIPRIAACQASLSTISQSLLILMSIESVIPSSQLILCCPLSSCPQSFPISWSFPVSRLFTSGSQRIEASASASVLTMNIQDSFPLELTGVSLFCLRDFQESFQAPNFKSICSLALSPLSGPTLTSVHDYWKNHSFD